METQGNDQVSVLKFIHNERAGLEQALDKARSHLVKSTAEEEWFLQAMIKQTIDNMETEVKRLDEICEKLKEFFKACSSINRKNDGIVIGNINGLSAAVRKGRSRMTALEAEITALKATVQAKDAEIATLQNAENAQDGALVSQMEQSINFVDQLLEQEEQMEGFEDPTLQGSIAPKESNDNEMLSGGWVEGEDSGVFLNETSYPELEL